MRFQFQIQCHIQRDSDSDGPIPEELDAEGIEVPNTSSPIANEDKEFLRQVYAEEMIIASDSQTFLRLCIIIIIIIIL